MSCATTEIVWVVGQQAKLRATFADINGVLADPTTVTFRIKAPDGTVTTYVYGVNMQLVKSATGDYYVAWTWTSAGVWLYSFTGEGAAVGYVEGGVVVEGPSF